MASFVLSLFPLDVLDEIWDLLRLSQFLRDFLPTLLLHSQKKKKNQKSAVRRTPVKKFFYLFSRFISFFSPHFMWIQIKVNVIMHFIYMYIYFTGIFLPF